MLAKSRLRFDSFGVYLATLLRRIRHRSRVHLSFVIHLLNLLAYKRRERRFNPCVQFIAVILVEHLGDIVACEPVSRYLREIDPSAKIIWFVRNEYRELVDYNPSIDFVLPVHCLTEKDYLKLWCRFDRVYDLHFLDRWCAMCGCQSNHSALEKEEGNEITLRNFYSYGNILQSMSRHAGLPPLNEKPNVYITERAISRVDELHLPTNFVVFHCSSNTPEKEWPKERWGKLADSLSAYGCGVVEVGLEPTLDDLGLKSYTNATSTLLILETAEIIRRGKIFIGIDSGPAHLANAVGTYGIVLLGSYLGFKKYNPFSGNYGDGTNATLLHVEGAVANIPWERVRQVVDNAFQSQRLMNGR